MSFGAALGGAAQGASHGLGRFSHALMQVLGAQQQRQQSRQAATARQNELDYRRHRDAVQDRANAEALEMRQKTEAARAQENETANRIRLAGMGFEQLPAQAEEPGVGIPGSFPQGATVERGNFEAMFSDPNLGRWGKPKASAYDPNTDPAFLRSKALATHQEGLMRSRPPKPTAAGGGLTDAQRDALRRGVITRLGGSTNPMDLEAALDDARKAPGVTDKDIDFLRGIFKREF
ncbi:MAG: hypothetical protein OXH66_14355 [Gemmatimonadetes bacterium]|nr:hypothetical protein [Gemmatimonadota bacterium]